MNKRDEHYREAERAAAQTRQRESFFSPPGGSLDWGLAVPSLSPLMTRRRPKTPNHTKTPNTNKTKNNPTGVAQDTEELVAMSAEADALEAQRAALARRLAEAEAALEHEGAAAERRERALSKRGGAQAGHLAALDRALELYRGALGLELVPADDELRLVFTQIDARAPERPFCFAVVADEEEGGGEAGGAAGAGVAAKAPVYRVTRCEPEVAELPALRAKLAATGDFAAFVKGMRRAFVAHAAAGAAGGAGGGGGAGGKKK